MTDTRQPTIMEAYCQPEWEPGMPDVEPDWHPVKRVQFWDGRGWCHRLITTGKDPAYVFNVTQVRFLDGETREVISQAPTGGQ